ncbi:hypothetical protein [Nonomuraea jiangxiensis]|uniref:Uncharacterized protein n=1 Tax=Nonomuraea jiangxiensis TaxID=633440 RepID=A0A1G9WFS9_9ACTN|nr:hypothetical protein [Nonomuraea jiangxiensis]SDM83422.1 hypothetical protein SAMN05421869_1592 [Nonomuraea jiangxiensis]
MPRDFYATSAQVLPIILLAFLWDSRFLENIATESRSVRRLDPEKGVLFWTRRRVRIYSLFVATTITINIGICLLVLVGLVGDSPLVRGLVLGGTTLALATLLTRAYVEIIKATGRLPSPDGTHADQPTGRLPSADSIKTDE